jgi:hypothetical protein
MAASENIHPQQFRQDSLWGESGALGAADRRVRENMARRITGADSDPDFVEHMGRSKATRADLLTLEHINPTVMQGPPTGGGSYSPVDNWVEYNPSWDRSDTRYSLYHELGHAIHIGGQAYGGSKYSAAHNPDPVQEGVADGFADRLSGSSPQSYRSSIRYQDPPVMPVQGSKPPSTILEGGPQWGKEGRAAYEASRSLAASGEMPRAPYWSYRSGTATELTQTPGYSEVVKPEHQEGLKANLDRDRESRHGRVEQQTLF